MSAKPTAGVCVTTGNFAYVLNGRGVNRWSVNVMHGNDDAGVFISDAEACRVADLIAQAFNTYTETGLTPRELAAQRDELVAALDESLEAVRDGDAQSAVNAMSAALAKVRGGAK